MVGQFARGIWGVCVVAVAGLGTAWAGDAPADPSLTDSEYERLSDMLRLKGGVWGISWKVSVTEAREEAVRQGKPIFMVVNTGNCLGYV